MFALAVPRRPRNGLPSPAGARRLQALICVVAVVLLLLLADYLHRHDVAGFAWDRWNVDKDRSVIEVLGYVQVGLAAAWLLSARPASPVRRAWAVTLLVVVADDALGLHEVGGVVAARWLELPLIGGMEENQLGELVVWALMSVPVLVALLVTHVRSGPQARRDSRWFVSLMGLLVLFAVGVDGVHSVLDDLGKVTTLIGYAEAAGEFLAMTAFMAFAAHVRARDLPSRGATRMSSRT